MAQQLSSALDKNDISIFDGVYVFRPPIKGAQKYELKASDLNDQKIRSVISNMNIELTIIMDQPLFLENLISLDTVVIEKGKNSSSNELSEKALKVDYLYVKNFQPTGHVKVEKQFTPDTVIFNPRRPDDIYKDQVMYKPTDQQLNILREVMELIYTRSVVLTAAQKHVEENPERDKEQYSRNVIDQLAAKGKKSVNVTVDAGEEDSLPAAYDYPYIITEGTVTAEEGDYITAGLVFRSIEAPELENITARTEVLFDPTDTTVLSRLLRVRSFLGKTAMEAFSIRTRDYVANLKRLENSPLAKQIKDLSARLRRTFGSKSFDLSHVEKVLLEKMDKDDFTAYIKSMKKWEEERESQEKPVAHDYKQLRKIIRTHHRCIKEQQEDATYNWTRSSRESFLQTARTILKKNLAEGQNLSHDPINQIDMNFKMLIGPLTRLGLDKNNAVMDELNSLAKNLKKQYQKDENENKMDES